MDIDGVIAVGQAKADSLIVWRIYGKQHWLSQAADPNRVLWFPGCIQGKRRSFWITKL